MGCACLHISGRDAGALGQAHRDIGGVIAMIAVFRAFEDDLARQLAGELVRVHAGLDGSRQRGTEFGWGHRSSLMANRHRIYQRQTAEPAGGDAGQQIKTERR